VHNDLEKYNHVFLHQEATHRALGPPTAAPTRSCHGERKHCNYLCARGPSPCKLTGSNRPTSSKGLTAGTAPSIRRSTQPRL
jgi:hypothetical protein